MSANREMTATEAWATRQYRPLTATLRHIGRRIARRLRLAAKRLKDTSGRTE